MNKFFIDNDFEVGLMYSMNSGIKIVGLILVIVIIFAKAYYLLEKYYYNGKKNNPFKNMTLLDFYFYSFDVMVFRNNDKIILSRLQQIIMLFIIFAFLD